MCPVLVLLACSEQAEAEADLCDGVECSGHGRCVAVDVEALCQCDDGYLTAGLNCVEPVPVPEIISFGPDEPKVTQYEHAIFTLVVSGPKGEPDPVDAQLETDDGAVIAQFGLSDQARVYKAAVSWAELDALEDITFIGSEARSFAVRMTDAEGTESTSSAELTLWCKGFGACRGLCNPAMMIHESLDLEPVETCEGWQCSSGADYPTDCLTNPTAYLWMSDAQLDKLMSDVKADIEADGFFYFMDQCMEVGVELHGGLARKFDKKAFKVKFNRETWFPLDPFVESDSEVHAAPIGFKQFILKAHWVDPSLLRDKLTHEYVRLVGGLSPRVTHVNLVLNGKYHGVYALTENILEDFFLRMELKADGNLYKAVSHQANLKQKADVMSGYEKKMNKSGSSEDLADLLDTIAKAPLDPDQFQDMVGEVIDLDLYFAYALVNVFANNKDWGTKNYYLYRDLGTPDMPFVIVNWDSDATWGLYWNGEPEPWDGGGLWGMTNALSTKISKIPELNDVHEQALGDELEGGIFSYESTNSAVEAIAAGLEDDVRFEECRWEKETTFAEHLELIDEFLAERPGYVEGLVNGE